MTEIINSIFSSTLSSILSSIVDIVPSIMGAVLVIIIGRIISRACYKIVQKVLKTVGIDKIGDSLNDIEIIQKTGASIQLSHLISKVIYYFIFFIFIIVATDILGIPSISALVLGAFNMIPKILVGLVILIFGIFLAEGIRKIVFTALESMRIQSAKLISTALFYFLFINIFISALAQAEINTDFLEQNLSILIGGIIVAFAIGYGLASKDMVANFLGSFYGQDKVEIGDHVIIDDINGKVVDIDRNTITIDSENEETIIPLSYLMKNKIQKIKIKS